MKSARLLALSAFSLILISGVSHAIDFKSVGAVPAVLYDAPSPKGRKMFVAPRGMPVEVVLTYGEWAKVRDVAGDLAWLESKVLTSKRNVIANVANAKVRSAADESSALLFTADKGVLLELLSSAASGWLKVRHRDGPDGFIKVSEVWGE